MKKGDGSMVYCLFLSGVLLMGSGCRQNGNQAQSPVVPAEQNTQSSLRPAADPEAPFMIAGRELYHQHCLVCHQQNGGGVSGLNPPLRDTEYVLGDKERLISILLNGSNVGLLIKGISYANAMPGFSNLSDEEIAHVASYIRNSWGNAAEPVNSSEVGGVRNKG